MTRSMRIVGLVALVLIGNRTLAVAARGPADLIQDNQGTGAEPCCASAGINRRQGRAPEAHSEVGDDWEDRCPAHPRLREPSRDTNKRSGPRAMQLTRPC